MGDLSVFPLDQGTVSSGEAVRPLGGVRSPEGGLVLSSGDGNPFASALERALAGEGSEGVQVEAAFGDLIGLAEAQGTREAPQGKVSAGAVGLKWHLRQRLLNLNAALGKSVEDPTVPDDCANQVSSPSSRGVEAPLSHLFFKGSDEECSDGAPAGWEVEGDLSFRAHGEGAPMGDDEARALGCGEDGPSEAKEAWVEDDPVGVRLSRFIAALEEMGRGAKGQRELCVAGSEALATAVSAEVEDGVPGSLEDARAQADPPGLSMEAKSQAEPPLKAVAAHGKLEGRSVLEDDAPRVGGSPLEALRPSQGSRDVSLRNKRGFEEEQGEVLRVSEASHGARKDRPVPQGSLLNHLAPHREAGFNGSVLDPAPAPGAWPLRLGHTGEAALGEGLVRVFQEAASGAGRATVVVEPPSLGRVEVQLLLDGGEVSARIRVDNRELLGMVQAQSQRLKESLEAQGLQVSGLSVDLRNDERRPKDGPSGKGRRSSVGIEGDGEEVEDGQLFRVDLRNGLLHWLA
ncbi:MAG: flagellar hook-length control protein FliK [Thermanaerothrix sp.]|nr:flagellar hook-length control protein FliK [Thermanaerothrix sp.]